MIRNYSEPKRHGYSAKRHSRRREQANGTTMFSMKHSQNDWKIRATYMSNIFGTDKKRRKLFLIAGRTLHSRGYAYTIICSLSSARAIERAPESGIERDNVADGEKECDKTTDYGNRVWDDMIIIDNINQIIWTECQIRMIRMWLVHCRPAPSRLPEKCPPPLQAILRNAANAHSTRQSKRSRSTRKTKGMRALAATHTHQQRNYQPHRPRPIHEIIIIIILHSMLTMLI